MSTEGSDAYHLGIPTLEAKEFQSDRTSLQTTVVIQLKYGDGGRATPPNSSKIIRLRYGLTVVGQTAACGVQTVPHRTVSCFSLGFGLGVADRSLQIDLY